MRREIAKMMIPWLAAVQLFGVVVFGICVSAFAEKYGGTLIVLVKPEPPTLASYFSTSGPVGQPASKVYEGLLEYDFDHKPLPGLAKSWKISEDGLTYTFQLQDNVKFHDGKSFTSADVQFTVMEVLKKIHPHGQNIYKELVSVDAPDPLTVIFNLANPAPYLIKALSGYESPIVPRHLFEGTDLRSNPCGNKPVGTGPYKFVEWKKGQYIRLDRNDKYWQKGLPYLDRMFFRFIPDASTRTAAIERGEIHYAGYVSIPPVDVSRLANLPHIGVTSKGYSMNNPMCVFEINTRRPPFDKRRVRQAVSYAIDRQFIVDNIWYGLGKPATSCMVSTFKDFHVEAMRYDVKGRIAKANKLLDEAGYPMGKDGIRFEILHDILPYGETWQRLGEYLREVLGEIGIKVKLRYEDVPKWLKRVFTDYDYYISSDFYYQLPDPVLGMHRNYLTSMILKGTVFVNASRYSNPRIDYLMGKVSKEMEIRKRAVLYEEIQKILAVDLPVIPVFEMENVTLYNKKFRDLFTSPLGPYHKMERAWLAN